MPTATTTKFTDLKRSLIDDGFCIIPDILTASQLASLRETSQRLVDAMTDEERARHVSTGSLIGVAADSAYAELIALPAALDALASLGYADPKFTSGYVISKPPHSPRLFWHYDWAAWDDPGACGDIPQQIFLMYYLTDTTPHNGCLRVIPGTHKRHHPLLDEIAEAHTTAISLAENLDRPEFADADGEVDVAVMAGDLVIGDSRILHASHANNSDQHRTVITLWFHPDMESLAESTQGFIANGWFNPVAWPEESQALVAHLRPTYDGDEAAVPWNRARPRVCAD